LSIDGLLSRIRICDDGFCSTGCAVYVNFVNSGMANLTVVIDEVSDLPVLRPLLNRLGLKYTVDGAEDASALDNRNDGSSDTSYKLLDDEESSQQLMEYGSEAFGEDWNTNDPKEDEYWNSFLK